MRDALYAATVVLALVAATLAIILVSAHVTRVGREADVRRCVEACGAPGVALAHETTCLCRERERERAP